jgi:hypothetical protein
MLHYRATERSIHQINPWQSGANDHSRKRTRKRLNFAAIESHPQMQPRYLRRRIHALILLALAVAVTGCRPAPESPKPDGTAGEWLEFTGSWNATGSRRTISLGADRRGSIIDLRGTMLLAGPKRPGVGFRAEVIALVDSGTGLVGRSVWTDDRGEQVFSELQGEGTSERNRITGKILGGTGRYAGATGSYEFSWQSVIEAEEGAIQGRAIDLKGRVLPGPAVPPK